MERQTVDFGIDLGTTNSAIARASNRGIVVIKNTFQADTTPSAVAKTTRGQLLVGQDALDKPDARPATRFKRLMGTAHTIRMADGSAALPEELSAEVLKALKASVQLRYDVELDYTVITVPAMFQQPQCEATHRAAQLAGLQAVALLQEPIAAATAYLNDNSADGDYMVFDLGGGTFDVSVVRLRDRIMSVLSHGGDNYLGGSDFDAHLQDWVLNRLKREHGYYPHLEEPSARYQLLKACERARIELSTRESTAIDLGDLDLPIPSQPLLRSDLETMIASDVTRTLWLARERLDQASLRPADIRCIFLVGGPTMTPCIRRRLKEELGIPVSMDQDPMTVVALGAATHASGLVKPQKPHVNIAKESLEASLEIHYEPVVQDRETTISGKVCVPASFDGDIKIARASEDWDTGWIPLRNSAFVCDVVLDKGSATEFHLALRDRTGTIYTISPATLAIRYGVAAAQSVTPYKYGVALEGGEFGVVVKDNQPLPTSGMHSFVLAKTIPAGSEESLSIYFLEGMSSVAKENVKVGELRIRGKDQRRTLREGETVDIRIQMDESRLLTAKVFLPLYDLSYEVDLLSIFEAPQVEELRESLMEAQSSVAEIKDVIGSEDQEPLTRTLGDLDRIETDLSNTQRLADVGAADRVAKKLSDAKQRMRPLSDKYGLKAYYEETIDAINQAEEIATEFHDELGIATAQELREEADRAYRLSDRKGLEAICKRAWGIFWDHYPKTRECWTGLIDYLRENRWRALDQAAYHEHLKRSEDCLLHDDREGLRLNARSALKYLPPREADNDRFYDAGLRL